MGLQAAAASLFLKVFYCTDGMNYMFSEEVILGQRLSTGGLRPQNGSLGLGLVGSLPATSATFFLFLCTFFIILSFCFFFFNSFCSFFLSLFFLPSVLHVSFFLFSFFRSFLPSFSLSFYLSFVLSLFFLFLFFLSCLLYEKIFGVYFFRPHNNLKNVTNQFSRLDRKLIILIFVK